MNLTKLNIIIIGSVLMILLAACGEETTKSADKEEATENKTIEMGQINWAENIAVTNMWKVILEEKGYNVNFNLLDMGTTMAALAGDELDIALEVWLPVQDQHYYKQYKDKVNFSESVWYENAKVGLVVPTYMEDINSIEDLNANKKLFEGEITGFDPGAGTMTVTEEMIKEYGLDYELLPSSEPAMLEEIKQAVKNEEPIVAPLWSPHRIFSEVELKYLEDPKKVFGGVEKIHYVTRQGFSDDYEEVSGWFKNWKMDDDAIGTLMTSVNNAEKPIEGARKWVKENQDLVDQWIK
ncbi:glycine betaine ABC transporter substrate-binding protein [Virgibacillus sp. DJP39]|uniref:glycine betaine ABC transporter substrate-binding protein n=1 Tax=Virgibacillus sp. DJP39 TaxID=3409790 RepID=UPI003BB52CEE